MTAIQWTDRVWNPVSGCTKVSKGCQHCYAERQADRKLPKGGFTDRPFTEVRCHPNRLDIPMHWKKPQRVFVNSMSDLFHEDVPDEFIDQVFGIMSACDRHTFQVLTKRPERMRAWFATRTPDISFGTPLKAGDPIGADPEEVTRWKIAGAAGEKRDNCGLDWPLRNVWLGVSVEDQATADERIPVLLETPAALRWVSYEPALGPVNFTDVVQRRCGQCDEPIPLCRSIRAQFNGARCCVECRHDRGLDWIVVGGESGPGARPFDVEWARSTVQQCKEAGVPVFVKQLGGNHRGWCASETKELCGPDHVEQYEVCDAYEASEQGKHCEDYGRRCVLMRDRKGGDPSEWPADLRVREWPEVTA